MICKTMVVEAETEMVVAKVAAARLYCLLLIRCLKRPDHFQPASFQRRQIITMVCTAARHLASTRSVVLCIHGCGLLYKHLTSTKVMTSTRHTMQPVLPEMSAGSSVDLARGVYTFTRILCAVLAASCGFYMRVVA